MELKSVPTLVTVWLVSMPVLVGVTAVAAVMIFGLLRHRVANDVPHAGQHAHERAGGHRTTMGPSSMLLIAIAAILVIASLLIGLAG
ncbi:MAG TPA: hypothetical protein VJM11_05050 [Nevskiaceae bacterium]|nr:hypothetical protein [Nevskiaceae bacterium]